MHIIKQRFSFNTHLQQENKNVDPWQRPSERCGRGTILIGQVKQKNRETGEEGIQKKREIENKS